MVKTQIRIGQKPTSEILKEIEIASKIKPVYDIDSPKLSAKELSEFQPANPSLYKPKKTQITLKIDADVLEAFKATGKGYQTRINSVLREAVFH